VGTGCQTERREEARLGLALRELGRGGCWATGRREKRERGKWAARGRKPAQEEGGRDGLRVRREGKRDGLPGWADFFSLISFSFLFQTNSILFEFK
jgi:hypothetical protein